MNATTIPTHALDCACELCEDMPAHSIKRYSYQAEQALQVSPLARAALDNGVSFEDVSAYCEARTTWHSQDYLTAIFKEQFDGSAPDDERADIMLDGALARSYLAQCDGSIAAARLWWNGVLL